MLGRNKQRIVLDLASYYRVNAMEILEDFGFWYEQLMPTLEVSDSSRDSQPTGDAIQYGEQRDVRHASSACSPDRLRCQRTSPFGSVELRRRPDATALGSGFDLRGKRPLRGGPSGQRDAADRAGLGGALQLRWS